MPTIRRVTYQGITDNLKAHSRRLGLKYGCVADRALRYGTDTPEALALVFSPHPIPPPHYRRILYNGVVDTVCGHAKRLGITVPCVMSRLQNFGVETPEALAKVFSPVPLVPSHVRQITYKGTTDSRTGWARRLGISPSGLRKRFDRGATDRQALQHGAWRKRATARQEAHGNHTRRKLAALGIFA